MTRASDVASFLSGVGPADQPTTLGAGVTFYDGGDLKVGGALTVTGNFVVNGTQTIINTETLEVEDKLIGIASVTSPSDVTADGAGIKIYGTTEKSITWRDSDDTWVFVGGGVTATAFYGDGSNLQGVVSGVEVRQAGENVGYSITALNFESGATLTSSAGIATITIAAGGGISTEASTGGLVTLDLSKQDHKVTATGITTITVSGGTEGESHTVRIVNSGIATVGFSTYFLFPSGSTPVLPTASGAISLVSFTVNQVGAAGTQLLAGASLNFS